MPRPSFDINEYELRGIVPEVFSEAQRKRLTEVLSRANGQMDWTAQMLGFSGTSYWGQASPKADGTYNWKGLPQTMNEKRQFQVGAYGVYAKDKEYADRPAPFNRSEIKASGDARIGVFAKDGQTYLAPWGQGQSVVYDFNSVLYVEGEYLFNQPVEFWVAGGDLESFVTLSYFPGPENMHTRAKILRNSAVAGIRIKDSTDDFAYIALTDWVDNSDWTSEQTLNSFIGVWGNKGASPSFDAQFDALSIHGCDEQYSLKLIDNKTCYSITQLMDKVGLKPTLWTGFQPEYFGFKIGECDIVYPAPPWDTTEVRIDNGTFAALVTDPPQDELIDATFATQGLQTETVDDGEYPTIWEGEEYLSDPYTFATVQCECDYEVVCTQTLDNAEVKGIDEICFDYEAKADCAKIDIPCLEWIFDPTLDDGLFSDVESYPLPMGPWATADDGEYDDEPKCVRNVVAGASACDGGDWCGFDDGVYNKNVEPYCDEVKIDPFNDPACLVDVDGGHYTPAMLAPDYQDCLCPVDCCSVDNGILYAGVTPYTGPNIVDGGTDVNGEDCVTYDNATFATVSDPKTCLLDNGTMESTPPTSIANSREYDRIYPECEPCGLPPEPPTPCPVELLHVNLFEWANNMNYSLVPTLKNAQSPLRLWKNRVLTVTDTVPTTGTDVANYFMADVNRGPEPFDSYRHFVRLPLEYERNGKEWNRAVAVCNNQSYFSAPPELSETSALPEIVRPSMYDETYFENLPSSTTYYSESFLVSNLREDSFENEPGFESSQVSFQPDIDSPFATAIITEYDAWLARIPLANGEWRGGYFKEGSYPHRTGFLMTDVATQNLEPLPVAEYPIYDMSSLKLPDVEFPDAVDQASLKNYSVSYAYFMADFSASDDPVFDPNNSICWRQRTIACLSKDELTDECVSATVNSNTAYLLHPV